MTIVETRTKGRPVIVARPDGTSIGSLSLDLAEVFVRARQSGAAACLLRPPTLQYDALFSLMSQDIPRLEPIGVAAGWLRARYHAATTSAAIGAQWLAGMATFWREIYRELRRHIGDDRLPYPLRTRLQAMASRSLARSSKAEATLLAPSPVRRLLRAPAAAVMPSTMHASAIDAAQKYGIPLDRPIVALDMRSRLETFHRAADMLTEEGYVVVRLGDPRAGACAHSGVIDLAMATDCPPALELWVLMHAAFIVCESDEVQSLGLLVDTPCLRVNAVDPLASYPVRQDGLFTMATAFDLATGRPLTLEELHAEPYLKRVNRYGHRPIDAGQLLDAVREMVDGVRHGWTDSSAQTRYRSRLIEVGQAMAASRARVTSDEPAFIGDGRLARVQADRLA